MPKKFSERDAFIAAQSELAKIGVTLKVGLSNTATRSELLEERANLRRGINTLHAAARDCSDSDSKRFEELTTAIEACGDLINRISSQLDLDEAAAEAFRASTNGSADSVLRDQAGNRIGVLLSNDDLRDSGKVAAKLGSAGSRSSAFAAEEDVSLSAFFRGVAGGRTTEAIRNALTEGTDSEGGHAVPSWLLPGILSALVPASSLLSAGANIGVLQQPGDSFKIAAVDTVPTAAWRLEAGELEESEPTFRAVTIIPRSLAFIFKVSRELLMDAPGIEQALRVAIAQAFAVELDRAGLLGSGEAPEIRGVLETPGIKTYDMGEDGGALCNYAPIIRARRLIADANAPAPTAIITSNREAETIELFTDSTGQPLRRPPALESLKFISTSQIPVDDEHGEADDASTMFLGNFAFATFYLRERISVQKLVELYAGTGEVGFACHARVDLALAYPAAFCAIKGVIPVPPEEEEIEDETPPA